MVEMVAIHANAILISKQLGGPTFCQVGRDPQDISLDSNNVNAHKISVRVSDNGDLDA